MSEREEIKEASHRGIAARLRRFIHDVIAELRKCSWPTQSELTETTILVVVMVFVMSAFIFAADMLFKGIFGNILKII